MFDKVNDECGIFGISLKENSKDLIENLYLGMFALQHRGQESAGMSYYYNNKLEVIKSKGLVAGTFFDTVPFNREAKTGIGHTRYPSKYSSNFINAQPLLFNLNKGTITIAKNGSIPKAKQLREELIRDGAIFQTESHVEILAHILSKIKNDNFEEALIEALSKFEGAYSILIQKDDMVIAIKDRFGIRPLSVGEIENGYAFASETNALDLISAKNVRELEPGEIIFCKEGVAESKFLPNIQPPKQCIFELVYIARPDSTVFGESVHTARVNMGKKLAIINKNEVDVVIAVPDSGNVAALGFSKESGVGLDYGLIRNHYIGRTFIRPTQDMRSFAVRIKLNPVKPVVDGKRMAVIDDSLVRGTTSKRIVKMLKEAGAKEVHMFLSSPEVKHSCFFGIDTPTEKELISANKNPEEVAKEIGADSVTFLRVEDLKGCVKEPDKFCFACFDGNYCIEVE